MLMCNFEGNGSEANMKIQKNVLKNFCLHDYRTLDSPCSMFMLQSHPASAKFLLFSALYESTRLSDA
jgi:hypothetical protein